MPTKLYYEIKKYCNVIPNFALGYSFAKRKEYFYDIFLNNKQDILQIIAMCCLESKNDIKKLGKLLSNEFYYFHRHVMMGKLKRYNKNTKKYKHIPDYFNHCEICNKDKKQYMYKSLFPGKVVCRSCYKKHKTICKKNNKKLEKQFCDICNKPRNLYMYKSCIPGKIICNSCYQKYRYKENKKK